MFTVKSQFVASHTGVLSALFTPKRGLGRTGCDTSTIKATTTSTEMSVIQAALPKGGVFVSFTSRPGGFLVYFSWCTVACLRVQTSPQQALVTAWHLQRLMCTDVPLQEFFFFMMLRTKIKPFLLTLHWPLEGSITSNPPQSCFTIKQK